MFLAEPEQTPYDLRWRMFGISVRVHPFFWLLSALLGWDWMQLGIEYLLIWIGCVFVSILLHELGHVLVGRFFGSSGHILLYSFGGLAIGSSNLNNRWQRVAVYFAGPGIQLILFALLYFLSPYALSDARASMPLVNAAILMLLWINLFWAIFNLFPIFPLDGGQISREIAEWFSRRNGARIALQISMGLAILLAVNAVVKQLGYQSIPYLPGGWYIAILFGLLAYTSFQALQIENDRQQWLDDHTSWEDRRR